MRILIAHLLALVSVLPNTPISRSAKMEAATACCCCATNVSCACGCKPAPGSADSRNRRSDQADRPGETRFNVCTCDSPSIPPPVNSTTSVRILDVASFHASLRAVVPPSALSDCTAPCQGQPPPESIAFLHTFLLTI
ncbi:MAG: hypothetical protein KF841_07400 [Phycisphaerae bacterium]|nr:hypothetical protein [Phycisphaerae bacterium]